MAFECLFAKNQLDAFIPFDRATPGD